MVDDHPVVRIGIRAVVTHESDMSVVGEAADGCEAVALYGEHEPDVVLMDLRMPGLDGVASIRAIVAEHPEARILALTSYEGDADIYRALDAGAICFLHKPLDLQGPRLLDCICAALGRRGGPASAASKPNFG